MVSEDEVFAKAITAALNGCLAPFEIIDGVLRSLDRPTQALIRMRYMRKFNDRQIGLILSLDATEIDRKIAEGLDQIQKKIAEAFGPPEPINNQADDGEPECPSSQTASS